MKKLLVASILLACSSAASAADLSFNNFALGYEIADFDCDTNCDGASIGANFELNDIFMLGFGGVSIEGFDGYGVNVGARKNVSDSTAIYGLIGASHSDFGTDPSLGFGVRSMLGESFELDFTVSHVFVDGGASGASLTGTYFFSDNIGASLNLGGGEGAFGGGLGLRVNF